MHHAEVLQGIYVLEFIRVGLLLVESLVIVIFYVVFLMRYVVIIIILEKTFFLQLREKRASKSKS